MVAKIKVLLIVIIIQFELHSYIAQFPTSISHSSASITMYKELLRDLFDDYDIRIRPRLNQSSTVEVNTSFTLNSIVDFDTAGQSIVIMGFFIITWYDEVLKWDPNDYGKTNYFRVRLNDIWYPQIELSKV
jgi:predicted PurR-regulated permease PerM